MVVHVTVTQVNKQPAARGEGALVQHWLQRRIQRLLDVLQQQRTTHADGVFERAQQVHVAQLGDLQVVSALHVADPLLGLALRIDHQRPPLTTLHQQRVVGADLIGGQALQLPLPHIYRIADGLHEVEALRARHIGGHHLGHPVLQQLCTVGASEGAVVGDAGSGDKHVAHELLHLDGYLAGLLIPPDAFRSQALGQLLGTHQALLGQVRLLHEPVLLGDRALALSLQRLHLVHDVLQVRPLLRQDGVGLCKLRVHLLEATLLRLHLLGDDGVGVHGMHPHAQAGGRDGHLLHIVHLHDLLVDVLPQLAQRLVADVVLVVVLQVGDELAVAQQLLRGVPVRLFTQQHAHRLHNGLHSHGRLREGLHLGDVLLVQAVQRFQRILQRRHGDVQISLRVSLNLRHSVGAHLHDALFRLHLRPHLGCVGLVHCQLLDELLRLLGLLHQHGLQACELLLQAIHLGVGVVQLLHADHQPAASGLELGTLLLQHGQVQVDEVQVRLGRGVHLSPQLLEEPVAEVVQRVVHIRAALHQRCADLLRRQLQLRQEARRH